MPTTFSKNHDKFGISKQYLFFYDKFEIFYLHLNDDFNSENLMRIELNIDKNNADTFIRELRIGSNSNYIVIILEQKNQPFNIIIWDIKANIEYETTVAEEPFEVLWDYKGMAYVV